MKSKIRCGNMIYEISRYFVYVFLIYVVIDFRIVFDREFWRIYLLVSENDVIN